MGSIDIVLKRFESPDEVRTFDFGRFESFASAASPSVERRINLAGDGPTTSAPRRPGPMPMSSTSVSFSAESPRRHSTTAPLPNFSPARCSTSHPPRTTAWVIGDEPYVSLHFLGAEHYADPTST